MPLIPTDIFNRVQPQTAQLELRFSAPLTTDEQVEFETDLIKLKYNYAHKLVWVKEHLCHFYLADGNGTLQSNWKRHWNASTIEVYEPKKEYNIGDVCYLNGVIYSAIKKVPFDKSPPENKDYWDVIAGEAITYRFIFDNTESVTFTSLLKNPMLEIFKGTFTKKGNEYVKDVNGMILLNNPEYIEADVEVNKDTNVNTYKISFFKDGKPFKLSGIINIK